MRWREFSARVTHMNERRRKEAADARSQAFFAQAQGRAR
jgi:hypothetical protein